MKTVKVEHLPRPLDAIQVTKNNFEEIAYFFKGEHYTRESGEQVVTFFGKSNRVQVALIGDWIVDDPILGLSVLGPSKFFELYCYVAECEKECLCRNCI